MTGNINLLHKLIIVLVCIHGLVHTATSQNCDIVDGHVRIEVFSAEVEYVEVDPVHNPGKCAAQIRFTGRITNITPDITVHHINFATDARPTQGFDSGLSGLPPGQMYDFDLVHNYFWIDCGSIKNILVLDNSADIDHTAVVCDLEANFLPIELVRFAYHAHENRLVWETASEVNNERFDIEQSFDANHWTKEAEVSGAGNASQTRYYDYTPNKTGYYRLKQIDFDGNFSYSPILFIEKDDMVERAITPFPNPAQDLINLPGADQADLVEIYDPFGANIISRKPSGNQLDISTLSTGMYSGILRLEGRNRSFRFVKTD